MTSSLGLLDEFQMNVPLKIPRVYRGNKNYRISILITDLTSSALYKDSGDSRPNTYTQPLYSFNVTLPVTWSWLFWMHERVNSHSGLNQKPEDKKERKAVIDLIKLINNLLYIRINTCIVYYWGETLDSTHLYKLAPRRLHLDFF